MRSGKLAPLVVAIVCMLGANNRALADDELYTEGAVTEVWFIRTKPGKFIDYMRWMVTERKLELEGFKKAGIILTYAVYSARPRTPQDADLIVTITYPNMAALDDLHSRTDPISREVFGSLENARIDSIVREQTRDVLGSEVIRELVLR